MAKSLRIILIVLLAAVFLFCAVRLISVLLEYRQAEEIYDRERDAVFTLTDEDDGGAQTAVSAAPEARETDTEPDAQEADTQEADTEPEESFPEVSVDFDALLAEGPDVVGWLWIPDSEISYPLVQGADNDQYLRRTYNGVPNRSGSIFLDYRCSSDLSDWNTVIYGHNMKNGSMFGSLDAYADQDYFDTHPLLYIFTPDRILKYRVFSAYVTEYDSETYDLSGKDRAAYVQYALDSSTVQGGRDQETAAPLLLLSTCTSRTRTERFVVHAVLIGEKTA